MWSCAPILPMMLWGPQIGQRGEAVIEGGGGEGEGEGGSRGVGADKETSTGGGEDVGVICAVKCNKKVSQFPKRLEAILRFR